MKVFGVTAHGTAQTAFQPSSLACCKLATLCARASNLRAVNNSPDATPTAPVNSTGINMPTLKPAQLLAPLLLALLLLLLACVAACTLLCRRPHTDSLQWQHAWQKAAPPLLACLSAARLLLLLVLAVDSAATNVMHCLLLTDPSNMHLALCHRRQRPLPIEALPQQVLQQSHAPPTRSARAVLAAAARSTPAAWLESGSCSLACAGAPCLTHPRRSVRPSNCCRQKPLNPSC